MSAVVRRIIRSVHELDKRFGRRSGERRILVDGHTPMNFTMVEPVFRAMERDSRVEFYFTQSHEPDKIDDVYREAPGVKKIHPRKAALLRFDAYLTSDFLWAPLPRGAARVQMFHGVGGKYGFDAPDRSMREWHRLFFVNERRLRNFIARGAVDADSPAIRLVGMPKVDCVVDGTFARAEVLATLGLDPARPTVLYAPTWSPASSLNAMGAELVEALLQMPVNVIVKLHDRSRDLRPRYSGGIDWVRRLAPLLIPGRSVLAPGHDISPYLVASDLMITDHSSAGFEFLLRDRPIVRIHRPQLIEVASIHPDYVSLLASVSDSVDELPGVRAAVERGLAHPERQRADRRAVATDLFYKPGTATARAVREMYELIDLEPAESVLASLARKDPCQKSA